MIRPPFNRSPGSAGFTIIELMIAIVVIVIGVLALSAAMSTLIRNQDLTAARADMAALADNKFEQLRAAGIRRTADTLQLLIGGSLTVSNANYNDAVTERGRTYTRRWLVTAGLGGSRDVTVRIIPPAVGSRAPQSKDFQTQITY